MQAESDSADSTGKPDWLKIGFNEIGRRTVLDIEVAIIKLKFFECT